LAGATEQSPQISGEAYEAIFKASSGIPRRINSVCDRLLLFGFLNNQKSFEANDVDEVAKEIFEETIGEVGQANAQSPLFDHQGEHLNLGQLKKEYYSEQLPRDLIVTLSAENMAERLARLERTLLQLEHINSTTLALLQKVFEPGDHVK